MDRLLSSRPEASGSSGEAAPDEGSMLGIVTAQRERFRKRVAELETENGRLLDSLGELASSRALLIWWLGSTAVSMKAGLFW